jgi:thiol-disulfide isomerase/thioredoxin
VKTTVLTRAKRAGEELPASTGHPGVYHDSRDVDMSDGETRQVDFRYEPFDPKVFRGDATARIRIVNSDGSPAAGRRAKVSYRDAHRGDLEVFLGKTSRLGEFEIPGITDRNPESNEVAANRIDVDEQVLGSFRFATAKSIEAFTFHLAPRVGDIVPDIELVNVSTSARSNVDELRGTVICLELWATWCGPCQEPMQKLNQLAADNRDLWRHRVAIVPLSIDEEPEEVLRHAKQRAWEQVDHYWSVVPGQTAADAPATRALGGQGVPELLVVGRDGRILWRGHPADKSQRTDVAARLEDALAQ